jgi:ferredoxin
MTIFYFTSTGNSLAVAKKIGGTLISVPQVADGPTHDFRDDVIGVVFPIYGFGMPKMVKKFCGAARFKADYMFAIGTYGGVAGAAMMCAQKFAVKHGYSFDYAESLLMVDNYLPGFDIRDQIAKIPQKKTDENLARIIDDIRRRRTNKATAPLAFRAANAAVQAGKGLFLAGARNYTVGGNCVKCGTCAKVCPAGNIKVGENVEFSDKCEWCLGCVHLCPQNAIHVKNEHSGIRWRHPDVTLAEIIEANDRTATGPRL